MSITEISKYYQLLFRMNIISDIFEKDPANCNISDETRLSDFDIDEAILKHRLFYYYGFRLTNFNELLWKVLEEIEKNLKKGNSDFIYSFWAIPDNFCLSHSHPVRDVFIIDKNIDYFTNSNFDVIIEIKCSERNNIRKNDFSFQDLLKKNGKSILFQTHIISEDKELDIHSIETFVETIDNFLAEEKKILLHSKGKPERLALILACWLVKHKLATEENFINKIAKFREGFWIDYEEGESSHKVPLNLYFRSICDQTREFFSCYRKEKLRILNVVPFLFDKEMIQKNPYWLESENYNIYHVDNDILKIIRHFSHK